MENDTLSITIADMMSGVVEMNDQCYRIFEELGGYNYNDDMLYQLQGLRESIGECVNEEDWKNMVTEASTTLMWFKHIEKIRKLEDSIPESLYC
tara:strand:+ start:1089 stop:1370 length:282 start_codon:yes stop_codon:yes gene_type:complete